MTEATTTAEENTQQEEQSQPAQGENTTKVQEVDFPQTEETEQNGQAGSIDILLDMELPITVAVGQTKIPICKLLQLGPGSVLKLDKAIDAPADLYLKDTKFATGNVVVVDNHFAIKIERIVGLADSAAAEKK